MPDKDILKQLGTLKEGMRLTKSERAQGLAELQKFMDANPVKTESWWAKFSRPFAYSMASFLVVAMAGGGVTYASTNSLPGDALYGFKTEVVEEVEAAFHFTAQAKADFEVERAERRLDEAAELAEAGELDEEKEAIVMAKLEEYTETIADLADKVEDIDEVREDWNAVFTAHEDVVLEIIATDEPQEKEIKEDESKIEDDPIMDDRPTIVTPVDTEDTKASVEDTKLIDEPIFVQEDDWFDVIVGGGIPPEDEETADAVEEDPEIEEDPKIIELEPEIRIDLETTGEEEEEIKELDPDLTIIEIEEDPIVEIVDDPVVTTSTTDDDENEKPTILETEIKLDTTLDTTTTTETTDSSTVEIKTLDPTGGTTLEIKTLDLGFRSR